MSYRSTSGKHSPYRGAQIQHLLAQKAVTEVSRAHLRNSREVS